MSAHLLLLHPSHLLVLLATSTHRRTSQYRRGEMHAALLVYSSNKNTKYCIKEIASSYQNVLATILSSSKHILAVVLVLLLLLLYLDKKFQKIYQELGLGSCCKILNQKMSILHTTVSINIISLSQPLSCNFGLDNTSSFMRHCPQFSKSKVHMLPCTNLQKIVYQHEPSYYCQYYLHILFSVVILNLLSPCACSW